MHIYCMKNMYGTMYNIDTRSYSIYAYTYGCYLVQQYRHRAFGIPASGEKY